MSQGDDDKKGFDLGGISFGMGSRSQQAASGKPGEKGVEKAGEKGVSVSARRDDDGAERGPLMPLRVLVVADLLPRGEYNAGASAPAQALRIDVTEFDEVFKRLRPRIAIEVESVLAEGRKVKVELAPGSMKSFRPDGLCDEVPLLRSLVDGKLVLERLRDGTTSVEQATSELNRLWLGAPFVRHVLGGVELARPAGTPAPAPAPAPAAQEVDVSRLLDMVDTGTPADATSVAGGPVEAPAPVAVPKAQKGRFDAFIAAIARAGKTSAPGARPDEGIRRIEKAIGLQLGAILQHPEVRRLEEAWRGLQFLCARTIGGQQGVRLELLCARPDETVAALERGVRANAASEPPVSFAVVDLAIDDSAASLARLREIAECAEAHTMPVVLNAAPRIFGLEDWEGIERLDNKASLYEAKERAPYRAVVEKLPARWVCLTANRFLGRAPFDKQSSRMRQLVIEEAPNDASAYVWLNASWAVAALVVQSFKKTSWPCRIVGARTGGALEDLPVREIVLAYEGSEKVAIPTEALISVESQSSLARFGVLVLACLPNTDTAHVLSAPTAYVTPPKRTYEGASTEPEVRLPRIGLNDQLFVARLAQFLFAL
ncbi:MAG: type VI secretion system contractile sheath large subunit, partial [Myxococcales bacterium]|nr:type VI secretion system contractile sheath large subunit [Myxococcales bacterium]